MLWSAAAGLRRIGPSLPTSPGDTVTQLTWSSDGRYLAWVQGVSGNLDQELVRYDTRAGTYATWLNPQEMGTISFSGSRPVHHFRLFPVQIPGWRQYVTYSSRGRARHKHSILR